MDSGWIKYISFVLCFYYLLSRFLKKERNKVKKIKERKYRQTYLYTLKTHTNKLEKSTKLEDMPRYAGQLLAPAQCFCFVFFFLEKKKKK